MYWRLAPVINTDAARRKRGSPTTKLTTARRYLIARHYRRRHLHDNTIDDKITYYIIA